MFDYANKLRIIIDNIRDILIDVISLSLEAVFVRQRRPVRVLGEEGGGALFVVSIA